MYITLYKQNNRNLGKLDYNNLMQTDITDPNIEYYKTTIYIAHPGMPSDKIQQKIDKAEEYIAKAWEILKPFEQNYEEQYYEFKIPKRSGGLRTINAPNPEFKAALTQVKNIFEQKLKCLAHNSAYAYTKNRSVSDALKVHQANKSNWFLKIDLTDFFTNCTPDVIYTRLKMLFPFYYFSHTGNENLKKIIKVCCLKGGLPQGTPISPLLTNLIMVSYDYVINNTLKRGSGGHYVYTRYADDILISSKSNFNWVKMQTQLQNLLTPFQIKKQKTRYGSKAGSNWNLGLMLNKDNAITIGSAKKKLINAMLNNFIRDFKANNKWSKEDTYHLQGQLSYLQQIEPEYYNYIIEKYQAKYGIYDYKTLFKQII